jgi:hypothetical protein
MVLLCLTVGVIERAEVYFILVLTISYQDSQDFESNKHIVADSC